MKEKKNTNTEIKKRRFLNINVKEQQLFTFSVRDITEIAILCALAIALDRFVKIPVGATGGSINLAALPLFIIAFRHGWFKGFIGAGLVFGVTTCLLDAYGFQYFLFDYFIAFGCIGLAGLIGYFIHSLYGKKEFKYQLLSYVFILLSVIAYCIIRTLSASVDSMIFYEYKFIPSVVYNISYIGPSAVIDFVLLCILMPAIYALNMQMPSSYFKAIFNEKKQEEENED